MAAKKSVSKSALPTGQKLAKTLTKNTNAAAAKASKGRSALAGKATKKK